MSKKIVLIDGHSILNRAFYGIPDLTNSEGIHTNAVYGFLNILFKILEEEKAEYLTVAFDVKEPTFRHIMYPEYKGTRKGMPEELLQQVPLMKEVLEAMGVKIIERPGYEADDILGTIAKQSERDGLEVSLVSGDRDLLQLATDKIKIRIPKTKRGGTEIEDYNTKDVVEKYMVTPEHIIDLKGLMGDTSDNIPGVPGIGEKTAAKILVEYGSIENAYEHIEDIKPNKAKENLKEHYDLAQLSKVLATIKTDCDLDYSIEDAQIGNLYNENAYLIFKRLEFKNILSKFNVEVNHNNKIEDNFKLITDMSEAETIFNKILDKNAKDNTNVQIDKGRKISNLSEVSDCFHVGLSIIHEDNEVYGIALSFSEEDIYYIKVEGFITLEYLLQQVNRLIHEDVVISMIGLKDDLRFLEADESSLIFDAAIAGYLLNPLKDTYYYDDIARDYLQMTVPSRADLLGKLGLSSAMNDKEREFLIFCGYSSYVAYQAFSTMSEKLKKTEMLDLFYDIEMPIIYTLYDMEVRGIKANKEELKEYSNQLSVRIDELEKSIYELVGEVFNINSPKQLGVILFEKLRLPFAKKTKTGYSTSADVLDKLKCEHPVINEILEYRQLTKLKSTYADGLANYIKEDNRIHGTFNQTITATGRISSTEPNLQNIPIRMEIGRKIRKVFVPEQDYVFLDADYSQIELRVLAHMSGDEMLINAYKEEQDIHKITASQVFHTPLEEVTSLQRSNAKAVNFGIVYGISSFGLGQDLNITRKEAESYISKYFETYPRVKEFLDELVEKAKKDGFVTSLFGRIRPIPEISSSNFMSRSFGERIAMNSPIQGTAADIIKIAMIRVNMRLKELKLRSRLLLQIHDELLIEAHKDEVDEVTKILHDEMLHATSLSVPLDVDVNQGMNWYEAK
ncbi:DNA polymerase I [Anaeromicropila herbilytica]|uniref:DNA polymerase I n=1 Tax=Anaeromicropila herbilytica TaxID=2785025 RepID=A0A7R7IDZ3_9FIRM|nr:DNA polymerase I [Anaeromicropila herbilytica]BCN30533.1 DNA polymerase [Anaeromicropila herbilytica]